MVDGKTYMTRPVIAEGGRDGVAAGGGRAGRPAERGNGQALFTRNSVLPRDTAYIGEAMPIEVRLYVDARVRAQLEELPEITAEGLHDAEDQQSRNRAQVTRNGRDYVMVTYKTAITAAQAGKVTLGPATVQAMAQLPQTRRRRRAGRAV